MAIVAREPGSTYTNAEFVLHGYLAIEATKEFTEECKKWKGRLPGARAIETQLCAYFNREYKLWTKKGASMREAGIANQAEITSILTANAKELYSVRDNMAATLAQERLAMQTFIEQNQGTNQTVVSAMTATTTQLQQQVTDLAQQLATAHAQIGMNNSACNRPPPTIGTG